jgi:PTS system nitrogen regulatory IIA component
MTARNERHQIRRELIIAQLSSNEKTGVIRELAGVIASSQMGVDHDQLIEVLLDREAFASTAIGRGVAIPNGKMPGLSDVVICLGRSQAGIDFGSFDRKSTHIFMVVLTPEHPTAEATKALRRIGRVFRETNLRRRLLEALDADEMYAALVEDDAKI